MSAEHRLLQNVIYNPSYNKEVRPVINDDDVMKVEFTLKLVQIVDVVSCDWLTGGLRDELIAIVMTC